MNYTFSYYNVYTVLILFINITSFVLSVDKYRYQTIRKDETYGTYMARKMHDGYKKLNEDDFYKCKFNVALGRLPENKNQDDSYTYFKFISKISVFCTDNYITLEDFKIQNKMYQFREYLIKYKSCIENDQINKKSLSTSLDKIWDAYGDKISNSNLNSKNESKALQNKINSAIKNVFSTNEKIAFHLCTDRFVKSMLNLKEDVLCLMNSQKEKRNAAVKNKQSILIAPEMESTVVTLSENDETPEQITKIKNIKYQQPEIDNQELETFSYSNIDKSAQHLLLALDDFKHYQELKNDLMPENRIIQIVYSFLYHLVQTVCVLRENVQDIVSELPSSSLNLINYSSRILKQSFSFFGVSDLFSNYMSDKLRVTKKLLSTNTEMTYCSNKMNEDPTYDIRIIKLVYELLCNTDNTLLMNLNVVMKHFYVITNIIPPEWQESDMLECKIQRIIEERDFYTFLFLYEALPSENDNFNGFITRRNEIINMLITENFSENQKSFQLLKKIYIALIRHDDEDIQLEKSVKTNILITLLKNFQNIPENQEWFKLIEKSSITEDLYDELREGKTIQNENYTTYMMRLFLNAHIPLYKDLWFEEYNLLYT